jgi:hypothetical protein
MRNLWLEIPGAVVALGVVIAFLWRLALIAARVDNALPTLLSIASEFKENGGSSLKDRLNSIDKTLADHTASDAANFDALRDLLGGKGNHA